MNTSIIKALFLAPIFWLLCCSLCFVLASEISTNDLPTTEKLSLDEAVKIAVAKNSRVKEADERLNSANEEKKRARADFFPKGSAEYTYTRLNEAPNTSFSNPFHDPTDPNSLETVNFTVGNQTTYQWNASLTQPLFTGFAILSQYQISDLGVTIAETEKELTVLDLVRNVKTAYYNVLLAKAALMVTEEAVRNLESHKRDAEQFYKQGMIPYNDLLKSKVALADAVQQREKAKAAVMISTAALNILLEYNVNHETDVEAPLDIPKVSYQLTDLINDALKNRPELEVLSLSIKSLDQVIRLAKSDYYPQVAMVGRYEQTGDNLLASENDFGPVYNSALLLTAKWDFFEGGKTKANVARYRYDKKALMKQYKSAENVIQLEVKTAFSNLLVSEKNIVTSQESLVQAEENWRITDLQYKEQIATSTDVLDARTELTQAESNYYSALYGYMISLADLERAIGKKYHQASENNEHVE